MLPDAQLLSLPKVELHCHLLGVISAALLRQAGSDSLVHAEALEPVLPVRDMDAFRAALQLLKPYQGASWKDYRPVLAHHIGELLRQGVIYTEIMISPLMFPQDRMAMIEDFGRFRRWVDGLEQGRLQVAFLMVMPRSLEADKIRKNTADYIALFQAGLIAGVAVVGLENGTSLRPFRRALRECREAGLGIEIHAGEHSGPANVRDALDHGCPHRIGHGIGLFQDPALIDRVGRDEIHLEFCLTSNLCTGSVRELARHPLHQARRLGLSYSINTDDPGLFGCSLTHEFRLLEQYFSFTAADFHQLAEQSLRARFRGRLT